MFVNVFLFLLLGLSFAFHLRGEHQQIALEVNTNSSTTARALNAASDIAFATLVELFGKKPGYVPRNSESIINYITEQDDTTIVELFAKLPDMGRSVEIATYLRTTIYMPVRVFSKLVDDKIVDPSVVTSWLMSAPAQLDALLKAVVAADATKATTQQTLLDQMNAANKVEDVVKIKWLYDAIKVKGKALLEAAVTPRLNKRELYLISYLAKFGQEKATDQNKVTGLAALDFIVCAAFLKAVGAPLGTMTHTWQSYNAAWPAGQWRGSEDVARANPVNSAKFISLFSTTLQKEVAISKIKNDDFIVKEMYAGLMTAIKQALVAGGFLPEASLACKADANAGWLLPTDDLGTAPLRNEFPDNNYSPIQYAIEYNYKKLRAVEKEIGVQYTDELESARPLSDPRTQWTLLLPDYSNDKYAAALPNSAEFQGFLKRRTGDSWAKKADSNKGKLTVTRNSLIIKSGDSPTVTLTWRKENGEQNLYWKRTQKTKKKTRLDVGERNALWNRILSS